MERYKINLKLLKEKNEEEIEKIFKKFEPIINYISKGFFLKGAENSDILQEGRIGLLKALQSFDDTKECKFETFAILCIKRNIITAIKKQNTSKFYCLNESKPYEDLELLYTHKSLTTSITPENIFFMKELQQNIIHLVKNFFSPLEKTVFSYFVQGYSYKEISLKLKCSPKKIDNTIQRVKVKIKNCIVSY